MYRSEPRVGGGYRFLSRHIAARSSRPFNTGIMPARHVPEYLRLPVAAYCVNGDAFRPKAITTRPCFSTQYRHQTGTARPTIINCPFARSFCMLFADILLGLRSYHSKSAFLQKHRDTWSNHVYDCPSPGESDGKPTSTISIRIHSQSTRVLCYMGGAEGREWSRYGTATNARSRCPREPLRQQHCCRLSTTSYFLKRRSLTFRARLPIRLLA